MALVLRLLVPLAITAFMVFTIVDLITIDNSRVKHLPKFAWILLAIVLSVVGCLLWFLVGREPLEKRDHGRYRDASSAAASPRRRRGPVAPDDDPDFLRGLGREREQDVRIRELEQRLAEMDEGRAAGTTDGGGTPRPSKPAVEGGDATPDGGAKE